MRKRTPVFSLPVCSLIACVLALSMVNGCSCWRDPFAQNNANNNAADEDENKPETLAEMEARRKELQGKKDEKPDYETIRLAVLPSDDAPTRNQVKPGHWFSAVQTMKANNHDFPKGDLESQCVDSRGTPIPLPGTEFDLSTVRPVSLPKGQTKHFDLLLFANMPQKRGGINFITRLRPRGGGREVESKYEATTRMKPFQNHLIVLADLPDNYQFVKAMRSVKPERSSDEFLAAELDYFVKLPKGTRRVDLPSHSLTWSNVAYVIWDDFQPEILTAAQQQAMIDWLHFGGQLIINGPRSLNRLSSSAFANYLPAREGSVGSVSNDQIAALNEYWSFEGSDSRNLETPEGEEAEKNRPLSIELELTDGAKFVENTAELVAEKSVGRGRVVATAFNLPHSYFQSWDSYDCFFNACLLGRPPRRFYEGDGAVVEQWAGSSLTRDDARVTSTVRYFSRDAMALTSRSKRSQNLDQGSSNNAFLSSSSLRPQTVPIVQDQVPQAPNIIRVADVDNRGRYGSIPTANPSPTVEIDIRGSDFLSQGAENSYLVTFQNTGNTMLTNCRINIQAGTGLQFTRATAGFMKIGANTRVLNWQIDNMAAGFGNSLEVFCTAAPDVTSEQSQLSAAFTSNEDRDVSILDIVVSESTETRHPLPGAASQAFAVSGFAKDDLTGVAGWSDQSDVSQAARDALQKAAGISVPSVDFIAKVLGLYLLILVPVNWLLFRLMGRVEWAWVAVPVISIGGALGVVKAAELDIGFARSRTEITLVELHPEYDRGHVTRYTGFYTSLTSNYLVSGEDETTLVQPFASNQPASNQKVSLYQGNEVQLSGFSVISNSTGLVHTEQLLNVGGTFRQTGPAGRQKLQNETDYDLRGATVVRRRLDDVIEVAWVGDLKKNETTNALQFSQLTENNVAFEEWDSAAATSRKSEEGELNIRRLIEIALDPQRLGRGESVLVGWNDAMMPGVVVKPDSSQVSALTLFVVQLSHADRPVPKRDLNSYAHLDRIRKQRKKMENENNNDE